MADADGGEPIADDIATPPRRARKPARSRTPRRRAGEPAGDVVAVDPVATGETATRETRAIRRRRSALVLPALVAPADLPEDAPGRVELVVTEADGESDPDLTGAGHEPISPPSPSAVLPAPDSPGRDPWTAVVVVALLMVAIFVVGMGLTR